jgi:GxxExxY protein
MTENEISYKIIGAAIELHKKYGPGLLESAWEFALADDLRELGFEVEQQVGLPFQHNDKRLDIGYRLDLLVNKKVIVEVKNVEAIADVHKAQLLTYLKLSGIKMGLLINFNSVLLKDGIIRYVNGLEEKQQGAR